MINEGAEATSRFKQLTKERYLVSKHTNTSYTDTGAITPVERQYILEFIMDEFQRQKEAYEKIKQESESKRR